MLPSMNVETGSFELPPPSEIEVEPAFPLPFRNVGFERAMRPHSRLRKLCGALAGLVVLGFTLFMVVIVMFDGDPPPGCLHDLMARTWSYEDSTPGYSAWNFCIPDCIWKRRIDRTSGTVLAGADPESVLTVAFKATVIIAAVLAGLASVSTRKRLVALDEAWQARYTNEITPERG
jgi:hypothetical protein